MEWVDQVVERARDRARFRVAALRATHPGEDQVALGRRLIGSSALRAGLSGAAPGTVALVAFPSGLPAGVAVSLYLEAELIFGLLEVYDSDTAGEQGRLKLYGVWAGGGVAGGAGGAARAPPPPRRPPPGQRPPGPPPSPPRPLCPSASSAGSARRCSRP